MTFAARPLWFLGANPNAMVMAGSVAGTGQVGDVSVVSGSIVYTPTGVSATGAVGNALTGFTSYTNPTGFDSGYFSATNYSNGSASTQLLINTDGTWTINIAGYDADGPYDGNWGNPTTSGGGNSLYYRYILNSVSTSGSAGQSTWTPSSTSAPYTSSWVQGTAGGNIINLLVTATKVGSGTVSASTSYTVQISTTASTAGLVAEGTLTMAASSTSNSPP